MTGEFSSEQVLLKSPLFNAKWYRQTYQDVDLLGRDAAEHFLRYGRLLERSPGPVFDTAFCLSTYADLAASAENPLLFHLRAKNNSQRPVNRDQLHALIKTEQARADAHWPSDEAAHPRPLLSYCLAAHELTDSFKLGLNFSLSNNNTLRRDIEFIIADLSSDSCLQDWVETELRDDLCDGYLRLAKVQLQDGNPRKAQNAFRSLMRGHIYSNMSAGDLIQVGDSRFVMDLARRFPDGFILHDFQQARQAHVSMPSWIYRNIGYDTRLLPQQQDQMDIVLHALCHYPHVPFFCARTDSVFLQASYYRDFLEVQGLANRMYVCAKPYADPPGSSTASSRSHLLTEIQEFNAAFTVMQHLSDATVRQEFLHKLNRHKMQIIESLPKEEVVATLFKDAVGDACYQADLDDICLFTCVHDEEVFLKRLVPHYRALGVTRFFIVDDHSRTPVHSLDLGRDVVVFRPKAGDFRTSKTLWLEGLMKVFVPEGAWVLTVDADEFLQIPAPFENLPDLTKALALQGRDFAAGILVDMLPSPGTALLDLQASADTFELFNHFLHDPSPPEAAYLDDTTVTWGFGPFAAFSWRFDVRHRLFGTIDSLRKLPLFRYDPERHPNQGFHTFDYLDTGRMPGPEIWESAPVLPIFHYKLVKLFDGGAREAIRALAPAYHSQTSKNILHAFGQAPGFLMTRIRALNAYLLPADKVGVVAEVFEGQATNQ